MPKLVLVLTTIMILVVSGEVAVMHDSGSAACDWWLKHSVSTDAKGCKQKSSGANICSQADANICCYISGACSKTTCAHGRDLGLLYQTIDKVCNIHYY